MNPIDHLIYATPDLEDGVREIEERFGVRAEGGGKQLIPLLERESQTQLRLIAIGGRIGGLRDVTPGTA